MVAKDLGESGADSRAYEQATLALQEAAQEAGDRQAEGRARVSLANVYNLAGRFADAEEQARLAMDAGDSVGDPVSSAFARNDRGLAAAYQSRYEDAETYLQQSLDLFLADGNQQSAASALSNLSRTHLLTDRVGSAVALAEQAVATYRELGVAMRLANGKYALGLALARAGRAEQAHQELTEALAIFRTSRQRLWEGMTHFRLAELQLAAGKPAQAASLAEQALSVLRGIGGEWRRANALTMLGRALNDIGQLDRARVCWQEALAVYDQLGSPEAAEVRALLQPLGTAA